MEEAMRRMDGTGDHIWLRYATQFTLNGRIRTVEMGIPVPLGASQEQREELLREAEAGMVQLSGHVEKVATQLMRGQTSTAASIPSQSTAQGGGKPVSQPPSSSRPAAMSAPHTADQPTQSLARASLPEPSSTTQRNNTLVRQSVGASMPSSAGGDVPNNLTIPQFLKLVSDTMGLDSKQAMAKLNVKSLSGVNLRKALEQLQQVTQQESESNGSGQWEQPAHEIRESLVPASRPSFNSGPIGSPIPASVGRGVPAEMYRGGEINRPVVGFDEEEQDSDEDEAVLEELEELDFSQELTNQQRTRAREVIKELREFGGMTVANSSRLQALNNVVSSQLSEQQLLQLIQGAWNTNAVKKLKIDQVEKLISWAKEDDFVNEAEDVLRLLEEEG
jgi:hypothetical protein